MRNRKADFADMKARKRKGNLRGFRSVGQKLPFKGDLQVFLLSDMKTIDKERKTNNKKNRLYEE